MKKITQLKRQYEKCLELYIETTSALQILSKMASEILGYDVTADLCHGSEIEFRRDDKDALNDNTILLEDIIEAEQKINNK